MLRLPAMGTSSTPPPAPVNAASVVDLHHTPVTLGVVLLVQGVALAAVLLIAGVVWGRIGALDQKLDLVARDVAGVKAQLAAQSALLQALDKRFDKLEALIGARSPKDAAP